MTIGFRIHKCARGGWIFIRDDNDFVMVNPAKIRAYSSLGSMLWHLAKRVKEIENADRDGRPGAGAGAGPQESGSEAQSPATGTGAGEIAPSETDPSPATAA